MIIKLDNSWYGIASEINACLLFGSALVLKCYFNFICDKLDGDYNLEMEFNKTGSGTKSRSVFGPILFPPVTKQRNFDVNFHCSLNLLNSMKMIHYYLAC